MKHNESKIVVILDRSGSMESVREATVSGFNEFITKQKQDAGTATLKLVQFDDRYEPLYDVPLQDVKQLMDESFVPRGMTALHDAIGRTINEVGVELSNKAESDRPEHVIFLILTDGLENASKEFTQTKVAELVKHQQEKYSWEFMFLGANQDAVLTASKYNIPQRTAMTYNANPRAVRRVMAMAAKATRSLRAGARASFSDSDRRRARS